MLTMIFSTWILRILFSASAFLATFGFFLKTATAFAFLTRGAFCLTGPVGLASSSGTAAALAPAAGLAAPLASLPAGLAAALASPLAAALASGLAGALAADFEAYTSASTLRSLGEKQGAAAKTMRRKHQSLRRWE